MPQNGTFGGVLFWKKLFYIVRSCDISFLKSYCPKNLDAKKFNMNSFLKGAPKRKIFRSLQNILIITTWLNLQESAIFTQDS